MSAKSNINYHNLFTIGFIYEGVKEIYHNNKMHRFCAGDMFCLGFACYGIQNYPAEMGEYHEECISFDYDELSAIKLSDIALIAPSAGRKESISSLKLVDGGFAGEGVRVIFDDIRYNSRRHNLSPSKRRAVLSMLLASMRGDLILKSIVDSLDVRLSLLEQTLRQNIFHDLTIEELADKCHLSPTNFKRLCLLKYDTSPHQWIVGKRIEKAILQLQFTSAPISRIASECGFGDCSYFIKVFKRHTGVTPHQFRVENLCNTAKTEHY